MTKGFTTDFYNQFEKLNNKLDKLVNENKKQSITIYNLNLEIEKLNKQLEDANKLNEKLQNEIDRLKNQNNKNSTNSSKPSSTDIVKPKKTGANLYNYRIKSDRKVGGQLGHTGHNLSKKKIEDLINNKKVEVRVFNHIIKGNPKKKDKIKYTIGIDIKPYVEKHIFKYEFNSKNFLPEKFYTDVTYDNSIKALSLELGAYNVVAYDRLSAFVSVITKGIINISNGTLVNFNKEFSQKCKRTLNNITNNILNAKDLNTDETSIKYNNELMYVRNYSIDNTVLYKAHLKKGHKPIIEDNILPKFCGGIMADHDTTIYSYGTKRYECNIHLGRYLEELIQNIKYINWPKKMKDFIFELNEKRKIAIRNNLLKFSDNEIEKYENIYDEILKIAIKENQIIKSTFYKEKADALYRRLKKYKENHLYFIKDFSVRFDNNISEQDLRVYKIKTKVSGCFRSIEGSENYSNILSIIKTSIKRNINPYDSICKIFNNEELFTN
ncbi:MAG: transposase [Bacilli bacterium]